MSVRSLFFFCLIASAKTYHRQGDHVKPAFTTKKVPLFPNGVEKMLGLWYNAVNLLKGKLFDDAFR